MKKRNILFGIFIALALTSCGGNPSHEHTFEDKWTTNESSHWHKATCEHSELTKDLADHVDLNKDGKCDACQYVFPTPKPEIKPKSIAFASDVSNITYLLNMEFDYVDREGKSRIPDLKVTYTNGEIKNISHTDAKVSYAGYKSSVEGEQTIKVYYTDNDYTISSSYKITVINEGTKITKQMGTVTVAYPEPATFSIEIEENPDAAYLFIWQRVDLDMDGQITRAVDIKAPNSNEITIKSTKYQDEYDLRCIVDDGLGHQTFSEVGHLRFSNASEYKHIFYFAEYAILPGTTFDVQEHYPDDKGTISLNSEGNELTIENVEFINDSYLLDEFFYAYTFWYNTHNYEYKTFTINVVGQNFITNVYNKDGSSLLFNLKSTKYGTPDIIFTGDGELSLFGGAISILTDSNIVIDTFVNIHTGAYDGSTGINCKGTLTVNENKTLLINSSLRGIKSTTVTLLEGSKLDIKLYPAVGPSGNIPCYAIATNDSVLASGADIDIYINVNPCMYFDTREPLQDAAAINSSLIQIDNKSNLNVNIVGEAHDLDHTTDGALYIESFSGLACDQIGFKESKIDINIDLPCCINAMGIVGNNIQILKGNDIDIDVRAFGQIYGISCLSIKDNDGLKIYSSKLDVTVDGVDYVGINNIAFAIIAAQFEFSFNDKSVPTGIQLTNNDSKGGAAFAAFKFTSHSSAKYDPEYKPIYITYDGYKTEDESLVANVASVMLEQGSYIIYETFYDVSETPTQVSSVKIVGSEVSPE